MKKTVLAALIAASFLPSLAMAEQGDWVVRLRATNINPSEDSNLGHQTDKTYGAGTAAALYGSAGAELEVDSNTIPELDISYYITKNIAAELILALGTKHDVNIDSVAGGVVSDKDLGEVNLLPPTLTLQWHFNPDQMFDPYVGAGVSYIRALETGLTAEVAGVTTRPIRIDRDMWGAAFQAGFDVNLQDRWLVNFDVKKIWFDTDVELDTQGALGTAAGFQKIDELDIDPWVISVGFGKKF